jgi:hypothetical protein
VCDSNPLATNNNYNTGQLVDFLTAAPEQTLDETSDVDPTQYANSETYAPFEQWMKRFVRIAEFPWLEGSDLATFFDPYEAYLTHPTVTKKIEGFSRFHMKGLEIKFLLNGAPTQFGSILVSYKPLPGFSGGEVNQTPGSSPFLLGHSCYPHVYLSVATSVGASLKIPFVCPKNAISPVTGYISPEARDLGRVFVTSIGPLKSVGSPSSTPIVISVYAKPIDLFMWGPTTYLAQSDDEYSARPVSTIASSIASAAGMLTSVPIIGPYMLATKIASGAFASVARLFGYSNPPVIDPVHVFANRPTYGISSPEIPVQMDKLSLDPKNELTVDPRTVGAPSKDGMLMSNMMDREVIIGETMWYSSDAVDTPLLGMYMTPEYVQFSAAGLGGSLTDYYGAQSVQMTPSCHLAQLFKYWRGPLHITFTVIASQFHRGRYVIEYEPAGGTNTDGQGLLRQWVVDIKDSPTFTVTIDMSAPLTWLPTQRRALTAGGTLNDFLTPRSLTPATLGVEANGTLRVRVINDLTSSAASTDVVMFVRMNCKDVEFACPMDIPNWPTTYVAQSETCDLAAPTMEVTTADESVETRDTPSDSVVYHGEVVKSVRTLLQRANHFQTLELFPSPPSGIQAVNSITKNYTFSVTGTNWAKLIVKWAFPRIGMQVGSVPALSNGATWALANAAPGTGAARTFVNGKPTVLAYLTPCYVGYRGGIGYRAVVDNNDSSDVKMHGLTIERTERSLTQYSPGALCQGTAFGHTGVSVYGQQYLSNPKSGASGLAVTNDVRYVDAVIPQYSRYRMLPAYPPAQQALAAGQLAPYVNEIDNIEVTAHLGGDFLTTAPTINQWMSAPNINLYQQAGVDFTLLYYLAPPTMYTYLSGVSYS